MMSDIAWEYTGKEFIDGVPARDLTQADMDWLHPDLRAAVEHSPLYRQAERPKAGRPRFERPNPRPSPEEIEIEAGEEASPQPSPDDVEGE